MTAYKRTRRLGRQPLAAFTKSVTLVQNTNNWRSMLDAGTNAWPEAQSIYNVACLCLYRRGVEKVAINAASQFTTGRSQPIGTSFWTDDPTAWPGICVFGKDRMLVASGAEFYSVSWLEPPDNALGPGGLDGWPDPEDWFTLIGHLAI